MGFFIVCRAFGKVGGLHRFPKKEEKRKIWMKSLKLGDYFLDTKKEIRVCFRHFRDSDYILVGTRKSLKPGMQKSDSKL